MLCSIWIQTRIEAGRLSRRQLWPKSRGNEEGEKRGDQGHI